MEVKFVATISNMGENRIIWIPKDFHSKTKKLEGKQVKITISDSI